jgi:hypothetical protein
MAETGKLTALLDRLHARITRLVWVHGLSTVAGAVAVLLVVAFLLDWGLHVPAGVRVVELALLLLIPVILAVRELVRPLRARPDRAARAVLIERAYPELRQLLVTATEITDPARPAGAAQGDGAETPALRARIVAEAERAAADIEPARALDPRRPRLRFLVGALACVGCAAVLVSSPAATAVFLDRLFLGNTPWPQRTHLTIEIPVADAGSTIPPHTLQEGEPLEIRVARGTDVPVVVRAEGAVPDEVTLHFSGGHRAVLAASVGPCSGRCCARSRRTRRSTRRAATTSTTIRRCASSSCARPTSQVSRSRSSRPPTAVSAPSSSAAATPRSSRAAASSSTCSRTRPTRAAGRASCPKTG